MQWTTKCARRWFDEADVNHLANMGKYVSAMVAAGARITYANQQNHLWFSIVVVTSVVATVYQLYWDFVKDWGLFNPHSKNLWLRDELILKNKGTYYFSMVSFRSLDFSLNNFIVDILVLNRILKHIANWRRPWMPFWELLGWRQLWDFTRFHMLSHDWWTFSWLH